MKYLFAMIFFIFSLTAYADIYMQTDKQGTITYSDAPLNKNAKKIDSVEINTTSSAPTGPQETVKTTPVVLLPNSTIKEIKKPYTSFMISSPADQDTIQNQPSITVYIKIDPALQEGDMIQVYLDGRPWGRLLPTSAFTFTTPERGIHQISAKLVNEKGQLLKETSQNTIYIHQAHVGAAPPPLGGGI